MWQTQKYAHRVFFFNSVLNRLSTPERTASLVSKQQLCRPLYGAVQLFKQCPVRAIQILDVDSMSVFVNSMSDTAKNSTDCRYRHWPGNVHACYKIRVGWECSKDVRKKEFKKFWQKVSEEEDPLGRGEKKWKGEVRKNAAELLNRKNWRAAARHIRD